MTRLYSWAYKDEDDDGPQTKKVKTRTDAFNHKEPENDINKEMKEKIEGILKDEDKKQDNKGEIEEEAEEDELNSDDDVSGYLMRV